MTTWVAATGSVRGAHHEHSGAPNEDHARTVTDGAVTIATVADGHGAPQYTRADRGSRLATRAAVEVLSEVPARPTDADLEGLPQTLVERWRTLVADDLADDPPTAGEIGRHDPQMLYGTTLLAGAQLEGGLLLVQLGDGDIVLGRCDDPEPATHRPIPPVQYAFPGATDSLVQDDADEDVRVALVTADDFDPEVVLLATDGLDAANRGRRWHAEVMAATCRRLGATAADELEATVQAWCREPARVGGDDTTMALLARPHLLARSS